MFIAGKMFQTPEEAKKWVEDQTPDPNERRHWIVLMLDPTDPAAQPPVLKGINDGNVKPQ